MSYHQTTITLPTYARGIHVITPIIEEAIAQLIPSSAKAGLFICFCNTRQPVSPLMKMLTQM